MINFKPSPTTEEDWEGVWDQTDRQYLLRLYLHQCTRCGKPLTDYSIRTICKECQTKEDQKRIQEYNRAKKQKLKQYTVNRWYAQQKKKEGKVS